MYRVVKFIAPLILLTAYCTPTPVPGWNNTPRSQEEIRKEKVEAECAMHPERCQDWDALLYDDSDLPDDPCRDYGICNGESNFAGQSSEQTSSDCPYGCTSHKLGCDIKGNISINSNEKIYHVPGQNFYNETKISPQYGERWFCTEQEAIANGWRKALN